MRSRRLEADDGGMSEGVIFFVIYVVAIVFILFMLWGLMRVAHAQMIPKWKRRPNDSFRVKNGHSWDYVLVFKVYDASEVLTKEQKKYSVRKVVERITSAGCETKMFFAVQRDEVFVKVRASLDRLKKQADDINYSLPLDPVKLRIHATLGKKDEKGKWIWLPIDIPDVKEQSPYDPYDCIHGQYDSRSELDEIYKRFVARASC